MLNYYSIIFIVILCNHKFILLLNYFQLIIHHGNECILLDNSDMVNWHVRNSMSKDGIVPSVVFRIPPPDPHMLTYCERMQTNFNNLAKRWSEKHLLVRIYIKLRRITDWNINQVRFES